MLLLILKRYIKNRTQTYDLRNKTPTLQKATASWQQNHQIAHNHTTFNTSPTRQALHKNTTTVLARFQQSEQEERTQTYNCCLETLHQWSERSRNSSRPLNAPQEIRLPQHRVKSVPEMEPEFKDL